jgi:hypothetical protein
MWGWVPWLLPHAFDSNAVNVIVPNVKPATGTRLSAVRGLRACRGYREIKRRPLGCVTSSDEQ